MSEHKVPTIAKEVGAEVEFDVLIQATGDSVEFGTPILGTKITGTVIERHDLPVFILGKDEQPRAGIPVPEGTDLQQASRRFLIENAKWPGVA